MEERLQKILAARGIASRRACELLIAAGRVRVNGVVTDQPGSKADPERDRIEVDGMPLPQSNKPVYILLFKPGGYICSVHDERNRRTVMDLLPDTGIRLFPVGRLDYDSSGALLLTNDGTLTNRLLHPSRKVEKTYLVCVKGQLTEEKLERLRQGIRLTDGMTAPAKVKKLRKEPLGTVLEISIHEGRNRQVRRMVAEIGCETQWLKRVRFACLDVRGMKPGDWRHLTEQELRKLYQLTEADKL